MRIPKVGQKKIGIKMNEMKREIMAKMMKIRRKEKIKINLQENPLERKKRKKRNKRKKKK